MAIIIMAIRGVNSDMIPTSSSWYGVEVVSIIAQTDTVKSFIFRLPHAVTHLPGQHYEIRLTADNGYQAARLYSAASAATGDNLLELTIALTPDGEVTPYLHEQLRPGDRIEMRGPLGRSFVWDPTSTAPVLMLAGGVGVVPLRCMLRAHTLTHSKAVMRLLYSTRMEDDIIYRDELLDDARVMIALTRQWHPDWKGIMGRLMRTSIRSVLEMFPEPPMCYVCGMTSFVEAANTLLSDVGVPPMLVKAERFGS